MAPKPPPPRLGAPNDGKSAKCDISDPPETLELSWLTFFSLAAGFATLSFLLPLVFVFLVVTSGLCLLLS